MNIDAPPRFLLRSSALIYVFSIAAIVALLVSYRPEVPTAIAVELRAEPDGSFRLSPPPGAGLSATELVGTLKSARNGRPRYYQIVAAANAPCSDDFIVNLRGASGNPVHETELTGFVYHDQPISQELYLYVLE